MEPQTPLAHVDSRSLDRPGDDRSHAVDVVRAGALVGICVVNLSFMGLPIEASFVPAEHPIDRMAAFFVEAFFQAKFFLLFSFLFGWGLHQQALSAAQASAAFGWRYGRRLLGLAVLGGLHAVLVFNGDILLLYAVLGLLVWPLRHLEAGTLMRVAQAMVPVGLLSLTVLALLLPDEIVGGAGLAGSYLEATRTRWAEWPATFGFLLLFQGPLAFGAFAAGLAAAKTGFFHRASIGRQRLGRWLPWLLVVGIPLNLYYAATMAWIVPPEHEWFALAGFAAIGIGGPMLSAVYLLMLVAWAERFALPRVLLLAGRNSLSTYVLQGILAGLLFGGYGLGLFGRVGQAGMIPLAVAVALVAMTVVGGIAQRSGRGPLEALLRSVTYVERINWGPARSRDAQRPATTR